MPVAMLLLGFRRRRTGDGRPERRKNRVANSSENQEMPTDPGSALKPVDRLS